MALYKSYTIIRAQTDYLYVTLYRTLDPLAAVYYFMYGEMWSWVSAKSNSTILDKERTKACKKEADYAGELTLLEVSKV